MVGELALDGTVRPIKGVLSMAMCAAEPGIPKMLVPQENAREAAVVQEIDVLGVSNLSEAVGILSGKLEMEPVRTGIDELFAKLNNYPVDFNDVRGQETAKRAMTVAASVGLMLFNGACFLVKRSRPVARFSKSSKSSSLILTMILHVVSFNPGGFSLEWMSHC